MVLVKPQQLDEMWAKLISNEQAFGRLKDIDKAYMQVHGMMVEVFGPLSNLCTGLTGQCGRRPKLVRVGDLVIVSEQAVCQFVQSVQRIQ